MGEEQRVAGLEVRFDGLGVHLALDVIGDQHHDEVRLLAGLLGADDPQALGLGALTAAAALVQADADVDAGIAQGQRVGVALAAEADHGNAAVLNNGQVGIGVVEHLSWHWWHLLSKR